MSEIVSYNQHLLEVQEARCRAALKMIDVPEQVYMALSGPILFQVAHLCCMIDVPMHWRDAIRWVQDHKGEIIAHAKKIEEEKRKEMNGETGRPSATEADS